ncbi:MAG: CvpA family protein [Planctomycetota bacterium]
MDFPLQPYDIFMLAVLVLATVLGAWKGMAWQLASLASILVSAGVALHFSGSLAPYISQQEPWNRFAAALILYLITSLLVWMLFRLVAKVIDRVRLKEFDRQVGGLFGFAKGVVFCLVITFFAVTLSESARQAILRSHSGYFIARLLQKAEPVLPDEVRNVLGKYIDDFQERLNPAIPGDAPGGPVQIDPEAWRETGEKVDQWLRERVDPEQTGLPVTVDPKALEQGREQVSDWLRDRLTPPAAGSGAGGAAPPGPGATR